MSILGENLKKFRAEGHYTQEDVAQGVNIPRGTYAHYELGRREPDNETLLKIGRFFNKTPSQLLGVKEAGEEKTPKDLRKILEDEALVTLNGRIVTQEDRDIMLRILEGLYHEAKELNKKE